MNTEVAVAIGLIILLLAFLLILLLVLAWVDSAVDRLWCIGVACHKVTPCCTSPPS